MNLGDMDELRAGYARRLPGKIQRIIDLLESSREGDEGDLDLARVETHKLKGSAGSYGFPEITDAARRIEAMLVNYQSVPEKGGELDEELRALSVLARAANPEAAGTRGMSEPRILLIDPAASARSAAREIASKLLIELHVAESADEALELAASIHFDAVLVDADLDADAPFAIAQRLRKIPGNTDIAIAVTSENETVERRVEAAHAGAAAFLSKPLTRSGFEDALNTLLVSRSADRPRLLCVDDDPEFRAWISQILLRDGCEVHQLPNSEGLMEALAEVEPDALLLDYDLPNFNGVELCAMLRANRRWKDLPILFVTGNEELQDRIAAYQAGCDDYLVKPVIEPELRARIRSRVDRNQLVRSRAERDSLTGLSLRGVFLADFEARLSGARRRLDPVTVCLLDLDHFKRINDTHGHLAGDRVLHRIGRLLSTRFRSEDLRCRWGGEEFALAFPGETSETIRLVMERVLDEFRQDEHESDDGELFTATFSGGIAEFPADAVTAEELIRQADRRLYLAKKAGRARVISEDE